MATYHVGQKAPESGIYACTALFCGTRRTIARGRKFPPCPKGHKDWELSVQTTKSRGRKQKGFLDSLLS
jgi:hypothetical protein